MLQTYVGKCQPVFLFYKVRMHAAARMGPPCKRVCMCVLLCC